MAQSVTVQGFEQLPSFMRKRKEIANMININEVLETNKMIEKQNLDVRTITLGINLLDCSDTDVNVVAENIYNKIWFLLVRQLRKNLVFLL